VLLISYIDSARMVFFLQAYAGRRCIRHRLKDRTLDEPTK